MLMQLKAIVARWSSINDIVASSVSIRGNGFLKFFRPGKIKGIIEIPRVGSNIMDSGRQRRTEYLTLYSLSCYAVLSLKLIN